MNHPGTCCNVILMILVGCLAWHLVPFGNASLCVTHASLVVIYTDVLLILVHKSVPYTPKNVQIIQKCDECVLYTQQIVQKCVKCVLYTQQTVKNSDLLVMFLSVKGSQKHRKNRSKASQKPFKSLAKVVQRPRKSRSKASQKPFKSLAKAVQKPFKSRPKAVQKPFKSRSKASQNLTAFVRFWLAFGQDFPPYTYSFLHGRPIYIVLCLLFHGMYRCRL